MTQKALLAIMDVINPLEDESEEMEEDEESDDEFAPIPEEVSNFSWNQFTWWFVTKLVNFT